MGIGNLWKRDCISPCEMIVPLEHEAHKVQCHNNGVHTFFWGSVFCYVWREEMLVSKFLGNLLFWLEGFAA